MNIEDQRVARLMVDQLPSIAALIDATAERFTAGGRIFFVGAGTSGGWRCGRCRMLPNLQRQFEANRRILAGGPDAMVNSIEDAEDNDQEGRNQMTARGVGKLDTVIGIAASGGTTFVIGALQESIHRGARPDALLTPPRRSFRRSSTIRSSSRPARRSSWDRRG